MEQVITDILSVSIRRIRAIGGRLHLNEIFIIALSKIRPAPVP
jgi:hypothetical protein